MIAAMNATKTSPSRNMVAVIRAVSPRSGAYLVRAAMTPPPFGPGCGCLPGSPQHCLAEMYPTDPAHKLNVSRKSAGDETFAGEHLAHLVHARILGRKDQVRRLQAVGGHRRALRAHLGQQRGQRRGE